MPKSRIREYAGLVLLPHSLFSLSFGLVAGIRASRRCFSAKDASLALLAFLCARTAANAFNRYADARIDALNPRTRGRHIPAGRVTSAEALAISAASFAAFVAASWLIEPSLALLALPAALLFFLYSYAKRFTALCHLMLGTASACAPLGAAFALCRSVDLETLLIACANGAWIAGFDVLYALRDIEFDRAHSLHSLPALLGRARGEGLGFLLMVLCPFAFLALAAARILGFRGFDVGFGFLGLAASGQLHHGSLIADLAFYVASAVAGIAQAILARRASKSDDEGIYATNMGFSIALIFAGALAFALERMAQ
jgi:4-hydroxybenzoate polyprenyltransferase